MYQFFFPQEIALNRLTERVRQYVGLVYFLLTTFKENALKDNPIYFA